MVVSRARLEGHRSRAALGRRALSSAPRDGVCAGCLPAVGGVRPEVSLAPGGAGPELLGGGWAWLRAALGVEADPGLRGPAGYCQSLSPSRSQAAAPALGWAPDRQVGVGAWDVPVRNLGSRQEPGQRPRDRAPSPRPHSPGQAKRQSPVILGPSWPLNEQILGCLFQGCWGCDRDPGHAQAACPQTEWGCPLGCGTDCVHPAPVLPFTNVHRFSEMHAPHASMSDLGCSLGLVLHMRLGPECIGGRFSSLALHKITMNLGVHGS